MAAILPCTLGLIYVRLDVALSIDYRVSSIEYRVSSIEYRVSSIEY
ncbi:hypothetical protein [Acinetobacter sp. 1125_18A]